MLVMHLCLVCTMNKIGRVFIVYILLLVVAATGAAELKSGNQSNSKVEQTGKPQSSSKVEQTNKPQSSSKVEHTGKPQSSSKVEHTGNPQSSSKVEHTGQRQSSSKVEQTSKPQSSSKVEQTSKPQSSSKVKHTGKPQSSSKVEHIGKSQSSSNVEQTSKPQSNSKVEYTGNPQSSSKVEHTGKPQSSSKVEQTGQRKESKELFSAAKKPTPHHVSAHASINHGMRVASITGVDSRYGRLSSMAGYKFYPPIDSSMIKTDSKGNFIFKSADGKMPMPITITKQGDGVSGTIRFTPGSVSVSSSAKSGSASASAGPKIPDFNPWSSSFMKPMMNDLFFPDPFPAFPSISGSAYHTRSSEPTFHRVQEPSFPRMSQPSFSKIQQPSFTRRMPDPWKDMYKHSLPRHDMMTPGWYYPSYNPYFNFW